MLGVLMSRERARRPRSSLRQSRCGESVDNCMLGVLMSRERAPPSIISSPVKVWGKCSSADLCLGVWVWTGWVSMADKPPMLLPCLNPKSSPSSPYLSFLPTSAASGHGCQDQDSAGGRAPAPRHAAFGCHRCVGDTSREEGGKGGLGREGGEENSSESMRGVRVIG